MLKYIYIVQIIKKINLKICIIFYLIKLFLILSFFRIIENNLFLKLFTFLKKINI